MKHRIMLNLWFCFEKDKREMSNGIEAEVTMFEKVLMVLIFTQKKKLEKRDT